MLQMSATNSSINFFASSLSIKSVTSWTRQPFICFGMLRPTRESTLFDPRHRTLQHLSGTLDCFTNLSYNTDTSCWDWDPSLAFIEIMTPSTRALHGFPSAFIPCMIAFQKRCCSLCRVSKSSDFPEPLPTSHSSTQVPSIVLVSTIRRIHPWWSDRWPCWCSFAVRALESNKLANSVLPLLGGPTRTIFRCSFIVWKFNYFESKSSVGLKFSSFFQFIHRFKEFFSIHRELLGKRLQ